MNRKIQWVGGCDFPRLLPFVMHRCGRSLLATPRTNLFRLYSTTPALATAGPATSLPKPNALTLIHKTSSLLPCVLSPAPKHPVESLKLWTGLLDYAHNASTPRQNLVDDAKARIVGAFILHMLPVLCILTCAFSPLQQCMGYTRTAKHSIS